MITAQEAYFIGTCLEGFFYGKQVLSALTCTLAKEVPGLGFYSGIFAIYLKCPSNKSRSSIILFYALCVLFVLSAATLVCDMVAFVLEVSNNVVCKNTIFLSVVQSRIRTLSLQLQIDSQPMLYRLSNVQSTASGCCDFLAQCILVCVDHCTYHPFYSPKSSKIYRCWIVWGQNIRVVIIPSFLAIAYLGLSTHPHLTT